MKILHYSLGFPPYRTGGMTKFCVDLMLQQNKDKHHVALMWPGQMRFVGNTVSIKDRGIVYLDGKLSNINSYEIINPLPVSYDEGISDFQKFTRNVGKEAYSKFLNLYKPDIIHIHTLMGLHKSFIMLAKEQGITMVFTAHDFFPICPKVTIFRHNTICPSFQSCNECGVCNATALGIKKIKFLQSPLYRTMKDFAVIKKMRNMHRNKYLSENQPDDTMPVGNADDFKELRRYYGSMLILMDVVHFNSTVTKAVYEMVFKFTKCCIVGITHADIVDHRKKKEFSPNYLKIRYLGPYGKAKGFFLLKSALDKLWNEGQNFHLDVHFTPPEMSYYMKPHERYSYSDLEEIFDETDILVVPSVLYETFSYTVLEALSYGVPVIMSDTVGAKDILADGAGIVIENITADKLYNVLKALTVDKLQEMNRAIIERQDIMDLKNMAEQIMEKCYKYH